MCMSARGALTDGDGPTSWRFASRPRRTPCICKAGPGASYVGVQHAEPTEIKSNFTVMSPAGAAAAFVYQRFRTGAAVSIKKRELLLLCTPGGAYPLMFHLL